VEAQAGAMLRAGEVADVRLVADFCRAYAKANSKGAAGG
jgi:hypothetical protein